MLLAPVEMSRLAWRRRSSVYADTRLRAGNGVIPDSQHPDWKQSETESS